ncbi:MAG TPA: TRAP transporter small permease subunit [Azospirillum sp.]|nr:TRAP transporter small permease subunit [Azospirillum sp.]
MLTAIEQMLDRISAVTIAGLTVLVVLDVTLAMARLPTYVSAELCPFLMAVVVFFSVPTVTREEAHIRADFCDALLSPRVRMGITLFLTDALFLVYAAVLLWITTDLTLTTALSGERSQGLLRTPMWLPQLAMVSGLFILFLRTVVVLASRVARFRYGAAAEQAGPRP